MPYVQLVKKFFQPSGWLIRHLCFVHIAAYKNTVSKTTVKVLACMKHYKENCKLQIMQKSA